MRIISAIASVEGTTEAVEILRKGGLVIFPTDTLYGLGASALDEIALRSVFAVKKRPSSNPLSIAVSGIEMMKQYAELPDEALKLARAFLPGPLTIVLKKKNLPDVLTGGRPLVGIRIPKSEIVLELIKLLGTPITATSANISGNPPPTTAQDAISQIPEADIVLDAGPLGTGLASTVIDMSEKPKILREGKLKKRELESVIGAID
ncbi:threonylcarbamoyl-AMP synthase [archaeon]|nr:threonylcarbamoyl-AMP synthase [archaeon]